MGQKKRKDQSLCFVLIRGLSRSVEHWDLFPEELSRNFPGAKLIYLELPGNGFRHTEKSPLSIRGFVESMRGDYLNQRGDDKGPVFFIAISLGGMIASEWLRLYPGDGDGIVLITTSNGRFSFPWQRLRPGSISTGIAFAMASSAKERELVIWKRVVSRPVLPDVLERYTEIQIKNPVSLSNTFRQLIAAGFYSRPPVVDLPALYIGSFSDRLVSYKCTLALARKSGKECLMHPDAGHEIPLDDPVWLVRVIALFVERNINSGI